MSSLKYRWTIAAGLVLGVAAWSVKDSWQEIDNAKQFDADVKSLDQRLQVAVGSLEKFSKHITVADHPLPQTEEDRERGVNIDELDQEVLLLSNQAKIFLSRIDQYKMNKSPSCQHLSGVVTSPRNLSESADKSEFTRRLSLLWLQYDDTIVKQRVIYEVYLSDFGRTYIGVGSSGAHKALADYQSHVAGFETRVADVRPVFEAHRKAVNEMFLKNWERREWLKLYSQDCAVDIAPRSP